MSKHFHFTLGPVQGFVAQARRTRDFWAGSFLLSWLTAHAMKAVVDAKGTIIMPAVEDDAMFNMVCDGSASQMPHFGSLPNNFVASVSDGFTGEVASKAVQRAWRALADAVWENDSLGDMGINRCLWNQQIKRFWDISWVMADSAEGSILAQRKNWRTYMPPKSEGDKCTMMGEWQELSGVDRPSPKQQQTFWAKIMQGNGLGLDLQEGERLCAISYVKRRFVHAWQSLEYKGHKCWELPRSVPSTSYIAAAHWVAHALQYADAVHLQTFHDAAKALNQDYGEWSTNIACIQDAIGQSGAKHRFASLDGRLFFDAELDNNKLFPNHASDKLKEALTLLKGTVLETGQALGVPSPFYAILMMDGDSLGETKAAMKDATALSAALGKFTKDVPELVKENNGFLVYAGGDDVLAILPLEDALPCAAVIRDKYLQIFRDKGVPTGKYSISAAIEYAHMKLPLTMILKDAHQLLDDVAKDGTGRDAVACRVWKPGGVQQTWAVPWDICNDESCTPIAHATDLLKRVTEIETRAERASDVGYATQWLYSLRETLNLFIPDPMPEKDADIEELSKKIKALQIDKLLEASYINSGLLDGWNEKEEGMSKLMYVQQQIALLMPLMRVYNKHKKWNGLYSSDGALLLRFLAQKGMDRGGVS